MQTVNASPHLYFILGDHLGSTSLVTSASGLVVSQTMFKAWGEVRNSSGTQQTNYTYTGQYSYAADFGLMFYNARWYDSSLGRFAQADTIVPAGVHGYDRYAYVNNNPLKYTDPSGHDPWYCETAACEGKYSNRFSTRTINVPLRESEEGSSILEIHELLEDEADAIRNSIPRKVVNNVASTLIGLVVGLSVVGCTQGFTPFCVAAAEIASNALGSVAEDVIKDPDAEKYDEVADTLLVAANDRNTKNIDTIKVHLTPWEATAVSLVSVDEYGYQTLNDIEPHYSLTIEGTSESITSITQSQARYINYLFGGGLLP